MKIKQIKNVGRRCVIVFLSEIIANSYVDRKPEICVDLNFWIFILHIWNLAFLHVFSIILNSKGGKNLLWD